MPEFLSLNLSEILMLLLCENLKLNIFDSSMSESSSPLYIQPVFLLVIWYKLRKLLAGVNLVYTYSTR